jgi:quinoprotein glucose dehydrogenase
MALTFPVHSLKLGVHLKLRPIFAVSLLLSASLAAQTPNAAQKSHDWPIYGGTPENNHFSPLTQINRDNVNQLQVAWRFDTTEEGGL